MAQPSKVPFKPSKWEFDDCEHEIKGKADGGSPRAFVCPLSDGKMYFEIGPNKTLKRQHYTITALPNGNEVLIKTDGAKIFMDKSVNADLMKMLDLTNTTNSQPFKFKSGYSSNPQRAANVDKSWAEPVESDFKYPNRDNTPGGGALRNGQQTQSSQSKARASTTAPPQSNEQASFLNKISGGKSLVAPGGSGGNEDTDHARLAKAIVAQNATEKRRNGNEDNDIRKQQKVSEQHATRGFAPAKSNTNAMLALLDSSKGLKNTFAGNGVGAKPNLERPPTSSNGTYSQSQSTMTLNNRGIYPSRPSLSSSSWQPMGRFEGMTNLGNTCYMGAITQALFALPKFSRDLQMPLWSSAFEHEQGGVGGLKPEKSVLHQLSLIAKLKAANTGKPLNLSALKNTVAAHSNRFNNSDQQDAHEFLVALLGCVEDECMMHAKTIKEFLSPASSMSGAAYARDLLATPGTWSTRQAGVAADQLVGASSAKTDRSGESTSSPSHTDASLGVRATPGSAISAVSSMCNSAISNHETEALLWDNTDAGPRGAALGSGSKDVGSVNRPTFYVDDDAATDSSFVDSIVSSVATSSDRKRRRSDESPSTKAGAAIDLTSNSDDDDDSSGPSAAKRPFAAYSPRTTIEVDEDFEFAAQLEADLPGTSAVRPLLASLLPFERSFRADVRVQLRCLRCDHHPDPRTEVHSHFQLELTNHNQKSASFTSPVGDEQSGSAALEQQLEYYFSDDVRDLKCEACKADAQVKASLRMTTLPGVLVLHLKRFRFEMDLRANVKIKTRVKFPASLLLPDAILDDELRLPYSGQGARMGKTADELKIELLQASEQQLQAAESALQPMVGKSRARYSLRAVVHHKGSSATSGHYICDRHDAEAATKRGDKNTWLRCDDRVETPVGEATVLDEMESPYVLFYTLDS